MKLTTRQFTKTEPKYTDYLIRVTVATEPSEEPPNEERLCYMIQRALDHAYEDDVLEPDIDEITSVEGLDLG